MLQNFTTAVRELQRTFSDAFNPYRPELYYMRGRDPRASPKQPRKRHPVTARAAKGFPATASRPRRALRDVSLRARTTITSQTASAWSTFIVSGFSASGPIIAAGSLATPPTTSN